MNVDEEGQISNSRDFFCCFCFRNKKLNTSSSYDSYGYEPYEYVVEKLAIKRVPLSLFATPEDLKRLSSTTPDNYLLNIESPLSKKISIRSPERAILKPPTNKVLQQNRDNINSDDSSHMVLNYDKKEAVTTPIKIFPSRILTEAEEEELVSEVLNRHSSLYPGDLKEAVPKDPENMPFGRITVSPLVRAALRNRNKTEVQVDVHNALIHSSSQEEEIARPKEVAPSLKKIIQALKFAQKPHLVPGNSPKNQKSRGDVFNINDHPGVVLNGGLLPNLHQTNSKLVYYPQEAKERSIFHIKNYKKTDNDEFELHFPYYSHQMATEENETNKDNLSMQKPFSQPTNNKIDRRKMRTNQNTFSNKLVNTSKPKLKDAHQSTESSQEKAQNLKWKIIIKHQQDKVGEDHDEAYRREEFESNKYLDD